MSKTRMITASMLLVTLATFLPFATGRADVFGWTRRETYNFWTIVINSPSATSAIWFWLSALSPFAWLTRPMWNAGWKNSWKAASAIITVGAASMTIAVLTEVVFARRDGVFVKVEFGIAPWIMLFGHLLAAYFVWKGRPRPSDATQQPTP